VISGLCTYGSVRGSLEEQMVNVNKALDSTKNVETSISTMDSLTETLIDSIRINNIEKEKMSGLENVYYTGQKTINAEITSTIEDIKEILEVKDEYVNSLEEKEVVDSIGMDIFEVIGKDVGLSGNTVLLVIFLILIVTLEVALYVTGSPFQYTVDEENREESEYEMICRYIDAMENENSTVLRSDSKISEITGISKKDCKRFREMLKSQKHRGKNLIHVNGKSLLSLMNQAYTH
jgi:hypothetical protein